MKQKLILFLLILSLPLSALAHSGGTDSNGGHYDRSTGQYHYHHGYSAHQHPNGVCPYEKKETVTKGTTYSNSIVSQPTSTPKRLIVITARPTKPPLRASSTATPRPSATSKVRPAVTVAPGSKVTSTSTPRLTPTPMITATPRITTTPRVTATPRNTSNTTAPLYVADEMSHVWNYLLLGGAAFVSLCVAIASYQSRKREHVESTAYIEELRRRLSTSSIKKDDEEKELQIAYAEMAKLEQKLQDANRHIEQQRDRQFSSANLSLQIETAKAEAKKAAEHELQLAHAKISNLERILTDSNHQIKILREDLKKAQDGSAPPVLMYVPPVPDPFPEVGDLREFYSVHYPTTWNYIHTRALNANSYLNYYHYIWGNLQINHGDGLAHGTLTEDQRALINYPPLGPDIYVATLDSPHYHSTPNCYDLLRSHPVKCSRSCSYKYVPCTKCVKQ